MIDSLFDGSIERDGDRSPGEPLKGIIRIDRIPGDIVEFIDDDGGAVFLFQHLFQPMPELDPVLYPEQPEFSSGFSVITRQRSVF